MHKLDIFYRKNRIFHAFFMHFHTHFMHKINVFLCEIWAKSGIVLQKTKNEI